MQKLNMFVVSGSDNISRESKEMLLKLVLDYFTACGVSVETTVITDCITQISYTRPVNLKEWLGTHRFVRYVSIHGRLLRTTSFVSATLTAEDDFNSYPIQTWTN
jgi:hypothetical protein